MGTFIDLTGQRFGNLCANKLAGKDKAGQLLWECSCDCGATTTTQGAHLRSGNTTSCGCRKRKVLPESTTKHGHATTGSPTYRSWKSMRNRCNNPNGRDYHRYGGRGIKVCPRWDEFANFLADMGEKPDGYSIERLDPNGDYEPANCTWIPHKDQSKNQQRTKRYPFRGEELLVREIAETLGVHPEALRNRIKAKGYTAAIASAAHKQDTQK